MAFRINGSDVVYDSEVVRVSANTTQNRPFPPVVGMLRFNTDEDTFEGYDGIEWGPIGGGGGDADSANTANTAKELVTSPTTFSIKEADGKLSFYYGTTKIASLDQYGRFITSNNITALGTP
jgi:hypothetical protein